MVFFMILAILFLVHKRENLGVVSLALSVFVKLITLPLIAVHWLGTLKLRKWRQLFVISLLFGLTTLLLYAPYWDSTSLFFKHLGYIGAAGEDAPDMIRSILRIVFFFLMFWFGLTQNGSFQRLLFSWTMLMLYFSLFLTVFALSWYLLSLVALVSILLDWRISLIAVLVCFSAFLFNSWYMTFADTFYVQDLFTLPNFVVYLLLPGTAILMISAFILWQKFQERRGGKKIIESEAFQTFAKNLLSLNLNSNVSGTDERKNILRILTYHRVANVQDSSLLDPRLISATPREFEKQMAYLARDYHVLSITGLLNFVENGLDLPLRAVLITFDDAYKDFKEYAWPILKKYNLPVVLFVPTGYPDQPDRAFWWDKLYCAFANTNLSELEIAPIGYLAWNTSEERFQNLSQVQHHIKKLKHSEAMKLIDEICCKLDYKENDSADRSSVLGWEDLRQLSKEGVTLGAHTRTHPILTKLSFEQIRDEITGSQNDLLREIGKVYPILAYPNGGHDERITRILKDEGFKLGFNGPGAHNQLGKVNLLRLRRINVTRRTNLNIFQIRLLNIGSFIDKWRHRKRVL